MIPSCVKWDGSPLTVKDLLKIAPAVLAHYSEMDNVLYVKTRGNPWTPVPLGWLVSPDGDYAEIKEDS